MNDRVVTQFDLNERLQGVSMPMVQLFPDDLISAERFTPTEKAAKERASTLGSESPVAESIQFYSASLRDLPAVTRDQWRALEQCASTPNVFLSPSFASTAATWLSIERPPLAVWGEMPDGRLVAWGLFEEVPPSAMNPFAILRCWQNTYTFRNGLLLAPGTEQIALAAFWKFVRTEGWHAVEFPRLVLDSTEAEHLQRSSADNQLGEVAGRIWNRARLLRANPNEVPRREACSSKRAKSLRRGRRWLERFGLVSVTVQRETDKIPASAETLLTLESMGWKATVGTALLSTAEHAAFFRELCRKLAAQQQIAFVELRVGNDVIASLSVLISGNKGFAFKIGWNPQWERGCPGFLLMDHLAQHLTELFPELTEVDSCSSPSSFIGHVWPESVRVTCCLFPLSRRMRMFLQAKSGLRAVRDLMSSFLSGPADVSSQTKPPTPIDAPPQSDVTAELEEI
ncbi:MAG: GNAT family N-acetyltransferase [Planctomycetaceae bacterium]